MTQPQTTLHYSIPFKDLVIASHNGGKIREIQELLSSYSLTVTSAADHGCSEPEETAVDFEGNALLKARYVAEYTGKAALADDSGLCVWGLDGEPGIYSARWAGANKDFSFAMRRIEKELQKKQSSDKTASFFCALALIIPQDKVEKVFLGRVDGVLTFPARGEKGFGYDPIFIPNGYTQTFAELEPDLKHKISHRADAFNRLVDYLKGRG